MMLHSCTLCVEEAIPERCKCYECTPSESMLFDSVSGTVSEYEDAVWKSMLSKEPALRCFR